MTRFKVHMRILAIWISETILGSVITVAILNATLSGVVILQEEFETYFFCIFLFMFVLNPEHYGELDRRSPWKQEKLMEDKVIVQERGWPGHFICGDKCIYHRNTLLSYHNINIVISTVGNMKGVLTHKTEPIGADRYYETMCFLGRLQGSYVEADVSKQLLLPLTWSIDNVSESTDMIADNMHNNAIMFFREHIKDENFEEKFLIRNEQYED